MATNSAWTENLIHEYELVWTIDNAFTMGNSILSPKFMPIPNCGEEWGLQLYVITFNPRLIGRGLFSQMILSRPTASTPCYVKSSLQFLSQDGEIKAKHSTDIYSQIKDTLKIEFKGEDCYAFAEHFAGAKIIVKAYFSITGHQIRYTISPSTSPKPSKNNSELVKHLKAMYQNNIASDMKISLNGRELQVHKSILCSRSPVFSKMLQQDMLESNTNCISISEVDFHVFDCFLLFLYTGEVEDNNWDTLFVLYCLADKYEVPSLKQTCSQIMASTLKVDNVCEALLLAQLHGDSALKDSAKQFIVPVFNQVLRTEKWPEIIANQQLSSEVLGFITSKIQDIAK